MIRKQKLLLFIVTFALTIFIARSQTVNGTITDSSDGSVLPGVSVIVKGTKKGVSTDFDGKYLMDVSGTGNAVLEFSFLGYITKEVAVNGRTIVNLSLDHTSESLDEIVVTAFGVERRERSLGYSISEVKGDEFTGARTVNVGNALSGKVAGVVVSTPSTGAGGTSRVVFVEVLL